MFQIDRQHENVYGPDNATCSLQGPSLSYGWEAKTSLQVTPWLSWNAGITQIYDAFFLGTPKNVDLIQHYVDSAPHTVAISSVTVKDWHGVVGSLRYRHVSRDLIVNPGYLAAPTVPHPSIYANSKQTNANGLDVLDFAATKKLTHGLEWNLSVDNFTNKHYFETQNFCDSRVTPTPRSKLACTARRAIRSDSRRVLPGVSSKEPRGWICLNLPDCAISLAKC